MLSTPILFGILLYANLRIIGTLHERKKRNVGERNKAARLKETNALVRATIVQAIIPMLVQIPLLVTTAIYVAGGSVQAEWDTFTAFVHSANPISSALITFIVVRPYRRALCRSWGIVSPVDRASKMVQRERISNISRLNSMIDMRNIDMEYLTNAIFPQGRLPTIS
uniref:G protein-coupled receptor n=1 Tax=Plectus sambesii TaxID=2011161 RepID=A0A914W505_9BILA